MLIDTAVWIDHLRRRNAMLAELLEEGRVWSHPFVIGELACGNLMRRDEVLSLLGALPQLPVISHEEALSFVVARRLMGRGLGWIDVHLLAAAILAKMPLWTTDKRLGAVATNLGVQPRH